MTVTTPIKPDDAYQVVIADDGVPVMFMPPLSPDDPWRLELDLRGSDLYMPSGEWQPEFADEDHRPRWQLEFENEDPRPPSPSPPPPRPRGATPPTRTRAPRARRATGSSSGSAPKARSADDDGSGGGDPEPQTRLHASGLPYSIVGLAHPPAEDPLRRSDPLESILELVRAGVVSGPDLLAIALRVVLQGGGAGRAVEVAAAPPKPVPLSPWQTPPVASRTVGVPVKIIRAMIKAKQISARLRNRAANPKQLKYLVNIHEIEAAVERGQGEPVHAPHGRDDVRELALRIRQKASRR